GQTGKQPYVTGQTGTQPRVTAPAGLRREHSSACARPVASQPDCCGAAAQGLRASAPVSAPRHAPAGARRRPLGPASQYVGRLGSICFAQASTPPPRCTASGRPARCSAASASADRPPDLQCSTIGLSCGSSASASPDSILSFGISFGPSIRTTSYSCGSRTSISSKSLPESNIAFSSCGVI